MKHRVPVILLTVMLFSGCQSGDTTARTDYSDSHFDTLQPRIVEHAKYLRSLDPSLTQEQAMARASQDFAAERRKEKKQQSDAQKQKDFEESLARSTKE